MQSFVGGVVAFQALTRPQFSQLQQKIFPIYFGLQSALPVVLALTYPASRTSLGTVGGLNGVFADVNQWTVLVPLTTMFVTSVANLIFIGPATTNVMRDRKVQGTLCFGRWQYGYVLTENTQKPETERNTTTPHHIRMRCRSSIHRSRPCMASRPC